MTDSRVVLAVVCFLGAVTLTGMAGLVYLVNNGHDLAAVGVVASPTSTALGALAALLVSTRSGPPPTPAEPLPVQLQQDGPIDVDTVAAPPAGGSTRTTPGRK